MSQQPNNETGEVVTFLLELVNDSDVEFDVERRAEGTLLWVAFQMGTL